MRDEPVYRGILGVDIERFSRAEWTDPIRARLRDRLHTLVDDALAHAEIDPALTVRSDTGDGLWLLADAQVPTTRLLHPLATRLASGLAADNRRMPAGEGMRLRVVVHAGELLHDSYGHTGASLNHAARLLDADATRAVLAACPAAEVALVVSDVLYDGVVRHAYQGIDPDGWQPVRVHGKETSARAWVHLPGLAAQPPLPAVLAASRVGPAGLPIPRELPRPPGDFTGRVGELASLRKLLRAGGSIAPCAALRPAGPSGGRGPGRGRPVVVAAIDGMGGIGKSALALQLADQLADAGAFPDGQLYVNLQGATPGLAPLEPLDALGRLLRALGLDPAQIPTSVEQAAARFRSLAAERRLLILLDNAHDAEQVRPLLPASPTCRVLVTSRPVLATLDGAHQLHLDVLPERQALELLGRAAGPERVAAELQAAAAVVRLCGSLPLALRIVGARLAARPAWPIRVVAEWLADATGCLDELRAGELAVRASFDVSLHTLTESSDAADRAAVAAFGLLSLPDGPDLGVAAAARLLDQPEPTTQRLLERLVDAQLLETPRPGRYQFHDVVRLHARQHATRQHPQPERLAALTRLIGFYTATGWHTDTLIDPGSARPATADPRWTHGGLRFADDVAAMDWLEAERGNLLAAITQAAQAAPAIPAALASQLTHALLGLFEANGYWHDGVQAN
jgi:NB-ARC domain